MLRSRGGPGRRPRLAAALTTAGLAATLGSAGCAGAIAGQTPAVQAATAYVPVPVTPGLTSAYLVIRNYASRPDSLGLGHQRRRPGDLPEPGHGGGQMHTVAAIGIPANDRPARPGRPAPADQRHRAPAERQGDHADAEIQARGGGAGAARSSPTRRRPGASNDYMNWSGRWDNWYCSGTGRPSGAWPARHTGRTDIPLTAARRGRPRPARAGAWPGGRSRPPSPARPSARCGPPSWPGWPRRKQDPDLWEWDYGGYEGRTTADIRLERPGWYLWRDGVIPGGRRASGRDHRPGRRQGGRGARPGAGRCSPWRTATWSWWPTATSCACSPPAGSAWARRRAPVPAGHRHHQHAGHRARRAGHHQLERPARLGCR